MPARTMTFMFTDIEGSTRLAQVLGPQGWAGMLERHRQLLRGAWAGHNGVEVSTEGDGFFVTFESASDALAAAADVQRALAQEPWPAGQEVRVRIGVHTGEAVLSHGGYIGHDIHRAARIGAAGYGGQILVSDTTAALVGERPPPGTSFRALGTHRLKDLRPQELCQLVVDGLPNDFPTIRSAQGRTRLPTQLTSFVGREREMTEVAAALEQSRLVTLTGPGGTGKTRLSIQVAAEISDRFRDGVGWVPLAAISDPDLVASEIATAVGARVGDNRPSSASSTRCGNATCCWSSTTSSRLRRPPRCSQTCSERLRVFACSCRAGFRSGSPASRSTPSRHSAPRPRGGRNGRRPIGRGTAVRGACACRPARAVAGSAAVRRRLGDRRTARRSPARDRACRGAHAAPDTGGDVASPRTAPGPPHLR